MCLPILDYLIFVWREKVPESRILMPHVAGTLFAIGWWLFFDGVAYASRNDLHTGPVNFVDWVPGVVSTLGFLLVNLVNRNILLEGQYYGADNIWKMRLFTLIAFVISIGAVSGSLVLLAVKFAPYHGPNESYFGATIVIQSLFVFISSMLFWFRDYSEQGFLQI